MEQLWTPWRMPFILSKKPDLCIFCNLPRRTDHHHYILQKGPATFVIMNLYPYTVGHLMVIPYRHLGRLSALSDEERAEMALRLRQTEHVLRTVLGSRRFHMGINLERAGGAGIKDHLHAHLVPRPSSASAEEGAALPGEADLDGIYERLAPHFAVLA